MKRRLYFPLLITLLFSLLSGVLPLGQGIAYAMPDTERQSPDALIGQINLSGTVTDIQDDPDSPDANWLTFITEQSNTECHVSFPTPTGNLTEGVDLQEFKVWARKDPGTGDPKIRIELYESDASKAILLPDTIVTSETGELFTGTWNANLLTSIDGSNVECYIFGTGVAGAPAAKTTVEVGAVEWNVTYTPPPSISNSPDNFGFGAVTAGSTPNTGGGHFTITNSSGVTIDITIKCNGWTHTAGSNDWIYGASAENTAQLKGSNDQGGAGGSTGAGNYDIIVPSGETGTLFCDDVETTTTTINWELQLEAPSSFTHGDPQTTTVTLTATPA